MRALSDKAFDFNIRVMELVKYLEEEQRPFPMANRLLECAEGMCVCLRTACHLPKNASELGMQAFRLALDAECLLELMVKTGFMNDLQSVPILTDCRYLKEGIKSIS